MTRGINDAYVSYFIICDSHSMNGGKHNYYGIFDRVIANVYPCVHPSLYVAIEVQGPPGETRPLRIAFESSEGDDVIPPSEVDASFSDYGGFTIGLQVQGLPIPRQGVYSFKVYDGDRVIGQRDLFVEPKKSEEE